MDEISRTRHVARFLLEKLGSEIHGIVPEASGAEYPRRIRIALASPFPFQSFASTGGEREVPMPFRRGGLLKMSSVKIMMGCVGGARGCGEGGIFGGMAH